MPKKNHTHKYQKLELANTKLWCCALPDCTHIMPKHYENSLIGKLSICWLCDKEFRLTPLNMQDDQPSCDYCKTGTEREEPFKIFDIDTILGKK